MNDFLFSILAWIQSWVGSWGWSMVVFTILVRLVLTPFDIKSRVSMRKTQKLQPQQMALQKKYANDKEKLNAKLAELYKKEHINPLSSCLPLLLTWPVIIAVFAAMRMVANKELLMQLTQILNNEMPTLERWLWIKNLWMPDSPFATYMPDVQSLQLVDYQVWNDVSAKLAAAGTIPQALSFVDRNAMMAYITDVVTPFIASDVYAPYIAPVAGLGNLSILGLIRFTIYQHGNGWFVLPILSVVTQIIMQNMTMKQTMQANPQAGSQKTMLYVMTFMSLYFCAIYNSAFALYWVVSNIYALVENIAFDRYFKAQDRKAAKAEEVGI